LPFLPKFLSLFENGIGPRIGSSQQPATAVTDADGDADKDTDTYKVGCCRFVFLISSRHEISLFSLHLLTICFSFAVFVCSAYLAAV